MAACFKLGVALKGLREAENTVAVEESCVLGNFRTSLFISNGPVLELNCFLKQGICFAIEGTA